MSSTIALLGFPELKRESLQANERCLKLRRLSVDLLNYEPSEASWRPRQLRQIIVVIVCYDSITCSFVTKDNCQCQEKFLLNQHLCGIWPNLVHKCGYYSSIIDRVSFILLILGIPPNIHEGDFACCLCESAVTIWVNDAGYFVSLFFLIQVYKSFCKLEINWNALIKWIYYLYPQGNISVLTNFYRDSSYLLIKTYFFLVSASSTNKSNTYF